MFSRERTRQFIFALVLCLALPLDYAPAARAQDGPAKAPASQADPGGKAAQQPAKLPVIDLAGYREIVGEHRGQALVVSFWATWCEPCQTEFPIINTVARKYGPEGLAVVGISLDEEADLNVERDFLKKMNPVFPSYRKQPGNDHPFIRGINPDWGGAIPATAFYARDGRLVAFTIGQNSPGELAKSVEQLLATPAR